MRMCKNLRASLISASFRTKTSLSFFFCVSACACVCVYRLFQLSSKVTFVRIGPTRSGFLLLFLLITFPCVRFTIPCSCTVQMKRLQSTCTAAVVPFCGIALQYSRRWSILQHSTKGSAYMKHLDLYARRDVQLAPYLLREVDIEYKRKCRKVSFLVWVVIFTVAVAWQTRMQGEALHYMRLYASYVRAEQDAKDEDSIQRRKAFVGVMNVVKNAFDRDQRWTSEDEVRALRELR